MPTRDPPRRAAGPAVRQRMVRSNLLTSMVLVFPLFLFYQFAVLFSPRVGNGADLITRNLVRLLHHSATHYLLVNVALTLFFVFMVLLLRRRQEFHPRQFLPVMLESALYAATMGTVILYVMSIIGIDPTLRVAAAATAGGAGAAADGLPSGMLARIALAVGAGVHEELVFRLLLLSGVVALLHDVIGLGRFTAIAIGFVLTAFVFSAAHHVIGGEEWRVGVFVYRFFCGLVFAAIFQFRGFAVAVYTHALYDVYVMLLR